MHLLRWHWPTAAAVVIGLLACSSAAGQDFAPWLEQQQPWHTAELPPAWDGAHYAAPPVVPDYESVDWPDAMGSGVFGGQHPAHIDTSFPPRMRDPLPPAPAMHDWQRDWQTETPALLYRPSGLSGPLGHDAWYRIGGLARGYYINDQRIEFTGNEETFAVEGVIDGGVRQLVGGWELLLEAEIFLNQPFDRNILTDTAARRSFVANFDIEPLQISQLYLGARYGDLYAAVGRFVTPFGRFYYPLYRNNFDDSPFIRSDAILYRETGFILQWDPAWWVFTAALTNGGFEQDTNSSKALVARIGIDQPWFAVGASIKAQDGIGSEGHKAFNEHVGLDAMVRRGGWTLSAEVIYDHHGLRRPGTALTDIFWGRSLYFRDLNKGLNQPIAGVGYYVNLGYEGPLWTLMLNYGEYYPEAIGDERHDAAIHRGLLKASRHWTRHFESYAAILLENDRDDGLDTHPRRGVYVLTGCQFAL